MKSIKECLSEAIELYGLDDIREYLGNICESCEDKGYLEVTCEDNCEYIQACDNCHGFSLGSHCDSTGGDDRAREQAIKDGYKLNKDGKIL